MSVRENTAIINDVLYEWVRLKHSPYKVAKAVGKVTEYARLWIIDPPWQRVQWVQRVCCKGSRPNVCRSD